MSKIDERLAELGITIPAIAKPVAAYVPAVITGNLVYTSGQLPFVDGALPATGLAIAGIAMPSSARRSSSFDIRIPSSHASSRRRARPRDR